MRDQAVRPNRLVLPSWLSPRIALGVLLVVGSVVAGAHVFANADRYSEVLVARQPLEPGERLIDADLTTGRVRFDGDAARYVAASSTPSGYLVTRYVGAGELVPAAALSSASTSAPATRLVAVPVAVGHVPLDLARGDTVDVYVSTKRPAGGAAAPTLVLGTAPVAAVSGGDALGGTDDESVVLVVPAPRVGALIAATESGAVDLALVPDPSAASG